MSTGDQALGDYHRGNSEAGPQQMSGHNSNVGNSQSLRGQHHHQQPLKFLPPPASTPSFTELLQDSASSVNSHVSFRASSDVAEQPLYSKMKSKEQKTPCFTFILWADFESTLFYSKCREWCIYEPKTETGEKHLRFKNNWEFFSLLSASAIFPVSALSLGISSVLGYPVLQGPFGSSIHCCTLLSSGSAADGRGRKG